MTDQLDALTKAAEQEWMEGWKRGPQRTRWTTLPLQVDDPAPDFELLDVSGKPTHLSSFWADQPALILFWRHYGCGCGMDRAKRLRDEFKDYLQAGSRVVIIGQGEPERAAAYAEKYELPSLPILCDPDHQAYTAYGLLEGKAPQILFDASESLLDCDLEAGRELAQARREAGRPLVDNSWLLPGEFVIDSSGVVVFAYRYNYCEDFPDHRVHLAAIREALN
jgi:peroxiredoxin